MEINDLIKLASLLDANGEFDSADEVDQLIRQAAEEGIVISPETLQSMQDTVQTMNDNLEQTIEFLRTQGYEVRAPDAVPDSAATFEALFEKLAQVADTLDAAGAMEEAGLIDTFLQKHAVDEYKKKMLVPESPMYEAPVGSYCDGCDRTEKDCICADKLDKQDERLNEQAKQDFERDLEQQGGMGDISKEMEDVRKEWEALQKQMKKAGYEIKLVKNAEGIYDVVKWKEEDKKSEQSKRYDSKHHHNLQVREPKREQERVDREGRKHHHIKSFESSADRILSQRYCPEHIGVTMGRVAESTFQCPLDNKVYNWDTGFSYNGKQNPGGSVAEQTPDSSGYFAAPHRLFDSRENTLNKVN
jgi:hypothetical protein